MANRTFLHAGPPDFVQYLSESGKEIELHGIRLGVCNKIKTQGLVLDSYLTFTDRVTFTIQRALGVRGRMDLEVFFPEFAQIQLTSSMILSVFYFCYPPYDNSVSK